MIVVVDYGMGNLGSIRNMLRTVGAEATVTSDRAQIAGAEKLILPGVGAFDAGMRSLHELGLIAELRAAVEERHVPVLGICLGMQLMCKSSEEGRLPGLGWVDGEVRRFERPPGSNLKVPHMGWNTVQSTKQSRIFAPGEGEQRFYFVHSYHVQCHQAEDVAGTSHYGCNFVAAFSRDNILGVQFHPEKSHRFGRELIKKFVDL